MLDSQSPTRVALVGCGGVARRYRQAYRAIEGVSVTVTIDVNAKEAADAAADTGAARHSQDFRDALAPGVDAVVLTTPNHLHCQQAVDALTAGKHVLLQKPMARTQAECRQILQAQRTSGATLGMYMNLLDHPLFHDLRRLIAGGHLGTIALFSARLAHRGGLGWGGVDTNWRASRERTGGGSFIQLGVHYQHLMRWLLGASVVKIQSLSRNVACPHLEGDDLTLAQYQLSNGALGEIQTSWCCQEEHVSVLGTKGSFHYRDNVRVECFTESGQFEGEVLRLRGDGTMEIIEKCISPEWGDAANPHNQHRRFFEDRRAGRPPAVSGEEGLEDVRLVEACYAAEEFEVAR
jgi:UDP-N-acetylglucosamine 3-dehydrogenase